VLSAAADARVFAHGRWSFRDDNAAAGRRSTTSSAGKLPRLRAATLQAKVFRREAAQGRPRRHLPAGEDPCADRARRRRVASATGAAAMLARNPER
jgi:hypothetical protein